MLVSTLVNLVVVLILVVVVTYIRWRFIYCRRFVPGDPAQLGYLAWFRQTPRPKRIAVGAVSIFLLYTLLSASTA